MNEKLKINITEYPYNAKATVSQTTDQQYRKPLMRHIRMVEEQLYFLMEKLTSVEI